MLQTGIFVLFMTEELVAPRGGRGSPGNDGTAAYYCLCVILGKCSWDGKRVPARFRNKANK